MRLHFLITCCIFYCISTCHAQENIKIEIEKRIRQEQTPPTIIQALQPLLIKASKIKYYQEKDSSSTFYEVKLKYKGKALSIKFTEGGDFYDLEETVALKKLPNPTQDSILAYFSSQYMKYKIKKTQIRFTSAQPQLIELYLKNVQTAFSKAIEIEAFVKLEKDHQSGLYEFLFTEKGELLAKSKILTREADYVLY